MVSAKQLAQLAKKYQRIAVLKRKRLTATAKEDEVLHLNSGQGPLCLYSANGRHFEVPLVYLSTLIFRELLRMSQEEFGFTSDGKVRLPCDAGVMEYVTCLLRRNASGEVYGGILSLHWLAVAQCQPL